jgi:hypothetical protein
MKKQDLRSRFFVELGLALVCAVFAILTVAWQDWLEIVFKIDPDNHSGALEWLIVAVAFALAITFSIASRREWRMVTRRPTEAATRGSDAQ